MSRKFSKNSSTTIINSMLIKPNGTTAPGTGKNGIPASTGMTQVFNPETNLYENVDAYLELQGKDGGLLINRMTGDEADELNVVNGVIIYVEEASHNPDSPFYVSGFYGYENDSWILLTQGGGGGTGTVSSVGLYSNSSGLTITPQIGTTGNPITDRGSFRVNLSSTLDSLSSLNGYGIPIKISDIQYEIFPTQAPDGTVLSTDTSRNLQWIEVVKKSGTPAVNELAIWKDGKTIGQCVGSDTSGNGYTVAFGYFSGPANNQWIELNNISSIKAVERRIDFLKSTALSSNHPYMYTSFSSGDSSLTTLIGDGTQSLSIFSPTSYFATLEIQSSTGGLLFPRLTDAQVTIIQNSTDFADGLLNGMCWYNKTTKAFQQIVDGTIKSITYTSGGTVTSIVAGTGLTGGTITTSGTIALADTAVTPGDYTNANLTIDSKGRIIKAENGGGGGTVTSITAGTNLTGGTITGTGTIALKSALSGLTSVAVGNISISSNTIASSDTNGNIIISPNGTGELQSSNNINIQSGNILKFFNQNNSFYAAFKALTTLSANIIWNLPALDNVGFFASDGSGNMSIIPAVASITAGTGVTVVGTLNPIISLENTSVTAGTYTNATITVDNKGRITNAASGGGGTVTNVSGTTNQINVINGTTAPVISLPNNITAPGSLSTTLHINSGSSVTAATNISTQNGSITAGGSNGAITANTTITAGTGLTVTSGNILVSNGNIDASGTIVAQGGFTSVGTATIAGTLNVTGAGIVMSAGSKINTNNITTLNDTITIQNQTVNQPTTINIGNGSGTNTIVPSAGNLTIAGSSNTRLTVGNLSGTSTIVQGKNDGTLTVGLSTGTVDLIGNVLINGVSPTGTGNVIGPASSTANSLPIFSNTTGKILGTTFLTVTNDTSTSTLGNITNPTSSQQAATKNYVDTIPHGLIMFTTSGSWTVPNNVTSFKVTLVGGGAGGGGTNTGSTSGGGGGAGGTAIKRYVGIAPGTIYNFVIGAAGTGGVGGNAGTNGGNSTFNGTELIANGGVGGNVGSGSGSAIIGGGLGGTAAGGDINLQGGQGGCVSGQSNYKPTGPGGNSSIGQGGIGAATPGGNTVNGVAPMSTAYGAGGSGGLKYGAADANGGDGIKGCAIIEW